MERGQNSDFIAQMDVRKAENAVIAGVLRDAGLEPRGAAWDAAKARQKAGKPVTVAWARKYAKGSKVAQADQAGFAQKRVDAKADRDAKSAANKAAHAKASAKRAKAIAKLRADMTAAGARKADIKAAIDAL